MNNSYNKREIYCVHNNNLLFIICSSSGFAWNHIRMDSIHWISRFMSSNDAVIKSIVPWLLHCVYTKKYMNHYNLSERHYPSMHYLQENLTNHSM